MSVDANARRPAPVDQEGFPSGSCANEPPHSKDKDFFKENRSIQSQIYVSPENEFPGSFFPKAASCEKHLKEIRISKKVTALSSKSKRDFVGAVQSEYCFDSCTFKPHHITISCKDKKSPCGKPPTQTMQSGSPNGTERIPRPKNSFKIPAQYLLCNQQNGEEDAISQKLVFHQINIKLWDEFYYGVSVLDTKDKRSLASFSFAIITALGGFVPQKYLKTLVYFIYFLFYFMTCLIYNSVGKLCSYYLIIQHFRIHESAYNRSLRIQFSGNSFEGPYNAYLRQIYCAHCTQATNEKVILNLMKKYKEEILKRS